MSSAKPETDEMELYAQGPPFDLIAPQTGITFEQDDLLPALPVPKLEDTLALYMDSVKPFATPEELKTTRKLVEEFSHEEGSRLQQLLVEYASTTKNWLEEIWLEVAYLRSRSALVPNCNFNGITAASFHVYKSSNLPGIQAYRAGVMVHFKLRTFRNIRLEEIKPEVRRDGRSLSMHQMKRLFNTCRIPGEEVDELETHFCTRRQGSCPRHIIVTHRGRLFLLRAMDAEDRVLSPPELTAAFAEILAYGETHGWNDESMCPLTVQPRTQWARNRLLLKELGDNAAILRKISEAVLLVRLEDCRPSTRNERAWFALGTDVRNFWADKSFTTTIFADGTASIGCDHSFFDGFAIMSIGIIEDQNVYRIGGKWSLEMELEKGAVASWPYPECKGLPLWEPLEFTSTDHLRFEANQARLLCEENCRNVEIMDELYLNYGRFYIRSFKVHPDTLVQLAIQLSYLRLHGVPGCTYETASTRQFWHGRTETIRSCTQEAIDWARHVIDHGPTHPRSISLFEIAHQRHNDLRTRCESGLGCDRHLLALQMFSLKTRGFSPALFEDPLWIRAGGGGNFRLSTSFSGYYTLCGFMPPMCSDGYAVFYRVGLDRINLLISEFRDHPDTRAAELMKTLHSSLDEISALLEARKLQNFSQISKL